MGGGLLAVWAVTSLAWAVSVGANLYYRASDQADMSAEIDHDLDAVACTGPQCGIPAAHAPQEDWTKVASTYLKFGYMAIIEWAMLPPVGLLLLCVGSCALHRRWTGSALEER